ncbi:MAG: DNA-directed RNA polymerase subunit H, partial [Candidatus Heimdallarchaeota archaeon]|nr:DNA-directed RNA polymerase subunit H [Candidatus Heimdallarchaeota archaeon]MCK4955358.1 DNA-directed RNA polymerase subunit H [Candidatus Heimdallarchaeota archaeon]
MITKEQQAKENRIIKGVKEILEFRGFAIKKTGEDDDFLDVYADKKSEGGEKITTIARFPKNPQIGVKTIRVLGKLQTEEEIDEALLIAEAPLTHYAKKESVKLGIEIISSSNPLFNIFDHELVPFHLKLNSREIKSFLTRYQIAKHQIPKILETDAAVKAIQAKPGDVIRIVRNPEMGDQESYYRVVIKSSSRLRLTDIVPVKRKAKTTAKAKVEAK